MIIYKEITSALFSLSLSLSLPLRQKSSRQCSTYLASRLLHIVQRLFIILNTRVSACDDASHLPQHRCLK